MKKNSKIKQLIKKGFTFKIKKTKKHRIIKKDEYGNVIYKQTERVNDIFTIFVSLLIIIVLGCFFIAFWIAIFKIAFFVPFSLDIF